MTSAGLAGSDDSTRRRSSGPRRGRQARPARARRGRGRARQRARSRRSGSRWSSSRRCPRHSIVPQRCLAAQRAEPATPHGALVLEPVATSVAGAGTVGVWRALDRAARASMLSVGSGPTEVGLRADPHRPIGVARTSLPNQTVEGSPAPEPTSPRIVGRRTSDDHGSAEYRAPNSDTHLHCTALHLHCTALQCEATPPNRRTHSGATENSTGNGRGASRPARTGRPDPLCRPESARAVKARRPTRRTPRLRRPLLLFRSIEGIDVRTGVATP